MPCAQEIMDGRSREDGMCQSLSFNTLLEVRREERRRKEREAGGGIKLKYVCFSSVRMIGGAKTQT